MQKLLTSVQMRKADEHAIANLPIASIDLMEKAARSFVQSFLRDEFDASKKIAVFCGNGNNGGDGLAIAHLLCDRPNLWHPIYGLFGHSVHRIIVLFQEIQRNQHQEFSLGQHIGDRCANAGLQVLPNIRAKTLWME